MNSVEALDVAIAAVCSRRERLARIEDRRSRNTAVNIARAHRLADLNAALETLTALREMIAEPFGGTVTARHLS